MDKRRKTLVLAVIDGFWCYFRKTMLLGIVLFSMVMQAQNVFLVNSTADYEDIDLADQQCADKQGNCTLRAAIQNANKTFIKDSIQFNIPGNGPFTIYLREFMPKIVEPLVLDGTTQPGYSYLAPQIVLSGEHINIPNPQSRRIEDRVKGLVLSGRSSGSTIRGFVMGGFGVKDYDIKEGVGKYFWGYAILIETSNNVIQGNFIGLKADGKTPFPNFWGIADVGYGGNLIGGPQPEDRNVISGNIRIGVFVKFKMIIEGNYIGTDAGGEFAVGNQTGILLVMFARENLIRNNVVSGNENGLWIEGEENFISHNYVGTNWKGTAALPNDVGILMKKSVGNTIASGNLISGNRIGLKMADDNGKDPLPQKNQIQGNMIGTDISGSYAIPNETGILLINSLSNLIGGTHRGEANIISGNTLAGIQLSQANGNFIKNNYIGTTPNGRAALPNGWGILFQEQENRDRSSNNFICNNLISGNSKDGVLLDYSTHTTLSGNKIGLQKNGLLPLPNGGNGIRITASAIANCIGGKKWFAANKIGFNHEHGIKFEEEHEPPSFYSRQIFHNRFYYNCKADVYPGHARPNPVSVSLLAEQ